MLDESAQLPPPAGHSGGFLSSVNIVLASNVLISGCGFLIVVVIARALGPDGRGITAVFQNGAGLGFALASLGVSVGVLYFVSKGEVSTRDALEAGLSITLLSGLL